MRLAIASPSVSAVSETFIAMQMERLPNLLQIHGRPVATETLPGGPIRPLSSVRGLLETAWSVGIEGRKWEGPQTAEVVRRSRHWGIDRILANHGPTGVALLPACQKLRIPLVVHFHGQDAHLHQITKDPHNGYRLLGEKAAAVIAVSHGMVKSLISMGIPGEKIHLLRYGVDPARFAAKTFFPPSPLFFGVGRFVDKKAPYLTLLAFAKARKILPDAKLILAGSGELSETVRNMATALELSDCVELPGAITPESVAFHMQNATAFVQHSVEPTEGPFAGDREGTPVAVLEAMMSGLPVISTCHSGIAEVVEDGRSGLLVEERDVSGMAAAMVKLGTSRELAAQFGRNGRARALEKYTAERYIDTLRQILETAR